MPSASVQAMTRSTAPTNATRPPIIHSRTSVSSRDQTHDIDDATLNTILQSSVDRKAFVRAQQDALDAINEAALARAIEASKETAVLDDLRRRELSETSQPVASTSRAAQEKIPQQKQKSTSSNPVPAATHSVDDEAAARELARSWRVDHLQPVLLNAPVAEVPRHSRPSAAAVSTASAAAGRITDAQSKPLRRAPSAAPIASSSKAPVASSSSSHVASSSAASPAAAGSSRPAPAGPSKPIPTSSSRPPLTSSASAAAAALSSSPPKATTARPPLRSAMTDSHATSRLHTVAPPPRPPLPRSTQPMTSASAAASAHASRQLSRGASTSTSSSSASPMRSDISLSSRDLPPPMKQSVSSRELLTGTLMNPGKEKVPIQSEQASPSGYSPEEESPEVLEIFKASRSCSQCGAVIASPRPLLIPSEAHPNHLTNLLHVQCSSCAANHCRGCFSFIKCPRNCSGGEACSVNSCCSQVRAIAIFEALSSFDSEYATEALLAGRDTKADRQNYLTHILENKDKRATQRFEKALIPTLRTICSWLQPSDVVDGKFHPSVERLFALSYLPEVIHVFLKNKRIIDWVALSGSYIEILEFLSRLGDCGLSQLLTEPLPNIERSCGLQCWVWDGGRITWESNAKSEFVYSPPLSALVKELRVHRKTLMELAERATFQPTMDKAHALRDGIAYLLLQQVVSG